MRMFASNIVALTIVSLIWTSNAAQNLRGSASHIVLWNVSDLSVELAEITATSSPTLIAGNGKTGSSGDNQDPALASLRPFWLWKSADSLFISDSENHVIRKVSGSTISTIAGTAGSAGYAGDGGPSVSAKFTRPRGLWGDDSGKLLVADTHNYRIRAINLLVEGTPIETIAGKGIQGYNGDGGLAINAQLFSPLAGWTDTNGNIFFTELHKCAVRWIDQSKIIRTLVGAGVCGNGADGPIGTAVQLNHPFGIFGNNQGMIYVTEFLGHRLRAINVASSAVTTIAGTGSAGSSGDGYAATLAKLNRPTGVWVDDVGNILVADSANDKIRGIDFGSGLISTVQTSALGVRGLFGDGSGKVYLPSPKSRKVTSFTYSYTLSSIPTNGLIAYFPFNGNTNDESGNGHNSVNHGASLSTDRFGRNNKAFFFNGATSYMVIEDGTDFHFPQDFSISVWMKLYSTPNSITVVEKSHDWGADGTFGYQREWTIESPVGLSNSIWFQFAQPYGWGIANPAGGTNIGSSVWNHYVIVKSENTFKTYINGTLASSSTKDIVPIPTNGNQPVYIGAFRSASSTERHFYGFLDEFLFYNRALSDAEITQLYLSDK